MRNMQRNQFENGRTGMVANRELTFDDYRTILLRRRWLLLIPVVVGTAGTYLLSLALPAKYTSHTVVLVEQPVVGDTYVKPVVSEDLNQRLASMKEQILSRTRLQNLVDKFGLYKKDVNHVPMEVLVERLQKSISVTSLSPMPGTQSPALPGFNVDVTLGEARLAQRVCSEITSMFMEQNLHLRQQQAEDTTQFLAKQLEEAKAKLDDQDAKLATFQARYVGALPDDEKTTLTLLTGMTPQLEAVTQSLNRARQDKAFFESLLSQQSGASMPSAEGENPLTLNQQLSNLQRELLSLKMHETDEHPDVVKLKNEIAEVEKKIQDASKVAPGPSKELKPNTPIFEAPQTQQLRAQLHEAEVAIQLKTAEQEGLQRQIKVLQARVQSSPMIQQEFKALTRDYQTALNFYNELLKKRNESQMATELENRQQGEQFRVLDPPSLPERPSFPNRPLFALGGLGVGLVLGIGLTQLAEWRDKSMRTKRDVEIYLGVPTLALIPWANRTTGTSIGSNHVPLKQRQSHLRASTRV
jgi:polysaccharide chain length determinant protein (PEP-CTERM system associated)